MRLLELKRVYYNLNAIQSIGTNIEDDDGQFRVNLWINQECHKVVAFPSRSEAAYFCHFLDVMLSEKLLDESDSRLVMSGIVKEALDKTLERTAGDEAN